MRICSSRFNIYLAALLVPAFLFGCQSPETKRSKKTSIIRVHIESVHVVPNRTREITVFRAAPTKMGIEPIPFVTEEQVKDAKVIDTVGGFALQIDFDRTGRNLIEQYTSGNKTRHIAIFARFAHPETEDAEVERWLAAPRISMAITNGVLIFTPDATRAESEQLALGLRNVAKKLGTNKEAKW